MILTEKNEKDALFPRRVLFGEEWFVSATFPVQDFFGVVIDGARPQPFPTQQIAEIFAYAEIDRRDEEKMSSSIQVIDKDYNVLLDLTTGF